MNNPQKNSLFAGFCIYICLLSSCALNTPKKYETGFFGLFDTYTNVIAYAKSESEFKRRAETIRDRLLELHRYFDIYETYEGINNLRTVNDMAGVMPVPVCGEIIGLLQFSKAMYYETDGAFNIALGSVLCVWHDYREAGLQHPETAAKPPMDILTEASTHTDIDKLIIDEEKMTVFLAEAGMSIDVGAVAKGYAAQLVAEQLEGGVPVLMDIGGNVAAVGKPPDKHGFWNVGVMNPDYKQDSADEFLTTLKIESAAIVTSGDYQRYYEVDGVRYGHIIDPGTLAPAARYRSVTIVHGDSGLADALSTALFILPYETGCAVAERFGAAVLWMTRDDEIITNMRFDMYGK